MPRVISPNYATTSPQAGRLGGSPRPFIDNFAVNAPLFLSCKGCGEVTIVLLAFFDL